MILVGNSHRPRRTSHLMIHAYLLIEEPEAVCEEIANVREVEECERNPDQGIDDRHQATPRRLRCHMTIPCKDQNMLVRVYQQKLPVGRICHRLKPLAGTGKRLSPKLGRVNSYCHDKYWHCKPQDVLPYRTLGMPLGLSPFGLCNLGLSVVLTLLEQGYLMLDAFHLTGLHIKPL